MPPVGMGDGGRHDCFVKAGPHMAFMCGRVIQSSVPFRLAIVEGLDVRDSRVHNYPPRWNGAPSQDLLVIWRNRQTGEVSLDPLRWGLIPYWCSDPKGGRKPINAKCETVRTLPTFRDAYARRRCIVPVDGFFEWKKIKGHVWTAPAVQDESGVLRSVGCSHVSGLFSRGGLPRCDAAVMAAGPDVIR